MYCSASGTEFGAAVSIFFLRGRGGRESVTTTGSHDAGATI